MENHKDKTKSVKIRFWVWESVTRRKSISTLPHLPKGGTFN